MSIHENSIQAHSEQEEISLDRYSRIYNKLIESGQKTDREVMMEMGFRDMNCVRPRITELVRKGWAIEVGDKVCQWTGKKVRVVKALAKRRDATKTKSLREQHNDLRRRYADLGNLTHEILSCLTVNLDRGAITTSDNDQFIKQIQKWIDARWEILTK